MVFTFLNFVCFSALIATVYLQLVEDELKSTRYIAALKGKNPPCNVRPGNTFCEDVPDYPYNLILQALTKNKFDVSKFFVDETMDEGPDFSNLNNDQKFLGHFTEADGVVQKPPNEKSYYTTPRKWEFDPIMRSPSPPSRSNPYGHIGKQVPETVPDYTRNFYKRTKRYLKMSSIL